METQFINAYLKTSNFLFVFYRAYLSKFENVARRLKFLQRFITGSRKDDAKPATTDIKLKKIMLTRPTLATTLATTASKLGSSDPEALELAAEAEVCTIVM